MKNEYITLPPEVILKIERDSQNESEALLESIKDLDIHLSFTFLIDAYSKLYKKEKGAEWFLIERHKNSQAETIEQYEALMKIQEDLLNDRQAQIETFKMKVK